MSERSDRVIRDYLAEIERTAGPDVAAGYSLRYANGWIHLQRLGSHLEAHYRLSEIETFTDNLRRRRDYDASRVGSRW